MEGEKSNSNKKILQNLEIQKEIKKVSLSVEECKKDIEEALKGLQWFIQILKDDENYLIQAEHENGLHEKDSTWAKKTTSLFTHRKRLSQ